MVCTKRSASLGRRALECPCPAFVRSRVGRSRESAEACYDAAESSTQSESRRTASSGGMNGRFVPERASIAVSLSCLRSRPHGMCGMSVCRGVATSTTTGPGMAPAFTPTDHQNWTVSSCPAHLPLSECLAAVRIESLRPVNWRSSHCRFRRLPRCSQLQCKYCGHTISRATPASIQCP